jgi:competence protein ComEC
VARIAGDWPQLGLVGVLAVAAIAALGRSATLRPIIVGATLCAAAITAIPAGPPSVPTITFLDVGQGDAVLLRDPTGAVALVDGGRDPEVLNVALRRYGVRRIDLLVASHGDADHVGGFEALGIEVGRLWLPRGQTVSTLLTEVAAEIRAQGASVDEVGAGDTAQLGAFELQVIGPVRRYGAENDGSIVLWVVANGHTAMLPGDIGAIAQRELPHLNPEVLLVPHHGAATTDLDWLAATVGATAVISVGQNTYGHPDPAVLARLEMIGVAPRLTMDEGDISMSLRNGP